MVPSHVRTESCWFSLSGPFGAELHASPDEGRIRTTLTSFASCRSDSLADSFGCVALRVFEWVSIEVRRSHSAKTPPLLVGLAAVPIRSGLRGYAARRLGRLRGAA